MQSIVGQVVMDSYNIYWDCYSILKPFTAADQVAISEKVYQRRQNNRPKEYTITFVKNPEDQTMYNIRKFKAPFVMRFGYTPLYSDDF